ncbi:MAG: aminotransferase class III-fold pyridoxal phosphate-dependent enzyme, partial [Candidatus Adiutrix sp.]
MEKSEKLFLEASAAIPGGVNSPVRACLSVGSHPVFVDHGRGARIVDVDGREYLDFVSSWGPLICGHCPPWVTEAVTLAAKKGTTFGAPTAGETHLAHLI